MDRWLKCTIPVLAVYAIMKLTAGAGPRRELVFIVQILIFGPTPRLELYNIYTSFNWGRCLRVPPGTLYRVPVLQTDAPCTGRPALRPAPHAAR